MSNSNTIVGRDIYYRVTDYQGRSRVHCARVWDADRFLQAQRENGNGSFKPEDRFTISPATEADYKAQQ